MQKLVEQKQEGIKQSQENRDHGIKVSSTMRGAIDITLAELGEGKTTAEYEKRIAYWRQFLWLEWDKSDSDFPPFR